MAVILDLADELFILIFSNISKPSHMLQLALANKRIHGIAIQHLYGNVRFDQDEYSPRGPVWRRRCKPHPDEMPLPGQDNTLPHPNILRLSNMIRSNTLRTGDIVTRITIITGINFNGNKFQTSLSLLLPQLSSLKDLTLKSVSRLTWLHDDYERFSLAPLGTALSHTSQTLESLSMDFNLHPAHIDGWAIGSLRHFSKLKYLSVQGDVILGPYNSPASVLPSLDSILPPGLKILRFHWCWVENFHTLRSVLANFVEDSLKVSRETEEIVVQLDFKATTQPHWEYLEESLTDMSEEARQGGLDLRMAVEWREDEHSSSLCRSLICGRLPHSRATRPNAYRPI